ncbi:uncharacterized protein Gasu_16720 [Galdieria sulphuraria]|uniref:Uncharacterized protein n=1 Tax=Galdieria sulphuraria TaxID=130081 RepID=M2Y5P9_GALSU|nr:uncharacterized protein Gasu_16720 [Galdieria sulphuraria]EME31179.1 hypothetical protein Gasu_16720 [Galdieria sulphuraria]|eukprot:XP_005707699.1 hypothetical protein Gasu_16720 [Galdieria sulphuraria]
MRYVVVALHSIRNICKTTKISPTAEYCTHNKTTEIRSNSSKNKKFQMIVNLLAVTKTFLAKHSILSTLF